MIEEVEFHERDDVYERLRPLVEIERTSYLWIEGDTPPFTPRLLPPFFGDGRALFTLATINQRPRYWIIRGDSTWECGLDRESGDGPDFAVFTDDILTALEEEFGNGRCGYSGSSLFYPVEERIEWCQCEQCADPDWGVSEWPEVDGDGGCSWGRMDWPEGFKTEPHPLTGRYHLLWADVLELTQPLPDGLRAKGQRLFFECRSCGQETEWEGEHDDFDVHDPANLCAGSPRCCP